jgi:hypothetical protein
MVSAENEAESARSDPIFELFIVVSFALLLEQAGKLPLMPSFDQFLRNYPAFSVIAVSLLQRSKIAAATTNNCGLIQSPLCGDSLPRYRGGDG